jgi:hypothetical protein
VTEQRRCAEREPETACCSAGYPACVSDRTFRPRELRGEGRPRRLGWLGPRRLGIKPRSRLAGGGTACAGDDGGLTTAEMWERPVQHALDVTLTWREQPAMSVGSTRCNRCVLSGGRFAVLGGYSTGAYTSSCAALTLGGDGHWSPLPPMHDTRANFACAAVARCIIVAGGGYLQRKSAEAYDEVLGRWLRLPHHLPHDGGLSMMDSTLL